MDLFESLQLKDKEAEANMDPSYHNRCKQPPKRDCPNFRAFPLRPAFLSTLFFFVCGLTVSLECLLRVLPNERDRNKIPQDSPYIVAQRRRDVGLADYASAKPGGRVVAQVPRGENSKTTMSSVRTRRDADTQQAQTTRPPAPSRVDANVKIPYPSMYANTDPIEGFVTWADKWYGDPHDPFVRTAVWPGQEVAEKCIYSYQGIVLTANNSGCRAIWDPMAKMAVPPGWKAAIWVTELLLVETEGKCATNYDDWYAGYPSNQQGVSRISNNEVNAAGIVLPSSLHKLFSSDLLSCTWANGSNLRTGKEIYDYKSDSTPSQVLFVYQGSFDRDKNGSIRWFTQMGFDYYSRAHPSSSQHIGVEVYATRPLPGGRLYLDDRPALIQGRNTPDVTAPVNGSDTSTMPSSTNVTMAAAQSTSQDISATQTSSVSAISFPPSLIETPVPVRYETTTQFTVDGKLTTKIITIETTTKVLFQLPPAMAPATAVTTQTDSRGQPTTTVTDFGGELILTTKLTTVTDAHGQPVATVLTTAPATSRVKTVTDASGNPIATVTSFPVYPKMPGAKPANIVLAKRFSYFFVYFFPILLSLLVLVPIHIIDAEIKLLIPFRVLADPTATKKKSIAPLHTRTDGLPGRLSGWRLLLHHGDPLSFISDLLVVCAACLVALSGETIGLKLRGTCIKQNMHTCLVTVAAFPTPARVAEALLGTLMVLILMLGFCLSRKRTGIAVHPGTIAAVCTLLQIPETRRVMAGSSPAPQDRKRLGEMLETRLEGTQFKLGWVEDGARANDYGLVAVHAPKQRPMGGPTSKSRPMDAKRRKMTFRVGAAERSLQVALLLFLCGVLTLLLYYENTRYTDLTESAFEYFMDSQEFGVILLFTMIGEVIYLLWDQFFTNYAAKSVFLHMAQRPQPAALSVLQPRSMDVFTALYRGIRARDPLASSIAFAGIISKATPALLSGIPFQAAQTFKVHEICMWSAIATLIVMILVLVAHMWLVKWPDLAAGSDSTLAVAAYYVCDSYMLRDFERLSLLGRVERDRRVQGMRRLYRFGWITGVSGETRVGIDYAEGEKGYQLKSLGAPGFGFGRGKGLR